ncbi:MAG: DsbA family protein [Gemmatimonadaceae bacterium]|nr:DsbA family protein [Gemmatimonadaceae bacterium]
MLPIRVNYAAAILFMSLACAPASSSTRGAESTSAASQTNATATPSADTAKSKDPDVVRADLARIEGSPSAKLWVVVVSDFQCPYCKQWHDEAYESFRREYVETGKVRFAYINYPLNSHQNAWPAAQAAMCAAAQDKFWPMHEALFSTQQKWEILSPPTPFLDSLARSLKLDMTRFKDCVSSGKMRGLIKADHDRALAAGATSTPTFLIGSQLLVGAVPLADMRKTVDSALAKAGKSTP